MIPVIFTLLSVIALAESIFYLVENELIYAAASGSVALILFTIGMNDELTIS